MRAHSDAMQFQMAILGPPTKRHKQFLKIMRWQLEGVSQARPSNYMQGNAISIASSFVFHFFI